MACNNSFPDAPVNCAAKAATAADWAICVAACCEAGSRFCVAVITALMASVLEPPDEMIPPTNPVDKAPELIAFNSAWLKALT